MSVQEAARRIAADASEALGPESGLFARADKADFGKSVLSVLGRSSSFTIFAIALLALLPTFARFQLGRGPTGYGILLGFFGGYFARSRCHFLSSSDLFVAV